MASSFDSLTRAEFWHRILSGSDEDERACKDIPDSACTDMPRNYLLNLLNGACTKLAEQLASPGLVLPWILAGIGAPAFFAGLLSPVKQAGSLLPQLAVSGAIRKLERRRKAWVWAGLTQALLLVLMAFAAASLPPAWAGGFILLLFLLFSAASGAGSVAFQDVTAKTVPKGRRGSLLANRATIGGGLTLLAAALLTFLDPGEQAAADQNSQVGVYLLLLALAACLWLLASLLFGLISEEKGATEGGRNMLEEVRAGIGLLRELPAFRHFLIARCLLLGVELAMPFLTLLAAAIIGNGVGDLGIYVFAVGISGTLSSTVWGRYVDEAPTRVLALSGGLAAVAVVLGLSFLLLPEGLQSPLAFALCFLLLGVAEQGVRLGRKTWLVDAAPKDERPLFAAFTNSLGGGVAVLAGIVLSLLAGLDILYAMGGILLLCLGGAVMAWTLPGTEELRGD